MIGKVEELLDTEILELVEDGKAIKEIKQADFNDSIFAAIVYIKKVPMTAPPTTHTTPPVTLHTPANGGGHCVKLPKFMLKAFNGDITTWT